MMGAQMFPRGNQKAAGAACGIADDVLRRRRGQLDHQLDDVARRAELAVLAGAGNLAEHILVEVALGVPVLQRNVRQHVDDLGQQRRGRNGEARALHVLGVRRAVLRHISQERKNMLGHDVEHLRRRIVLEAGPAQLLIGHSLGVAALGKDAALHGPAEGVRFVLLADLDVIQPPHEEQVGDLLDDLQRISDPARPEGIPHLIDFRAQFPRQHSLNPTNFAKPDLSGWGQGGKPSECDPRSGSHGASHGSVSQDFRADDP